MSTTCKRKDLNRLCPNFSPITAADTSTLHQVFTITLDLRAEDFEVNSYILSSWSHGEQVIGNI